MISINNKTEKKYIHDGVTDNSLFVKRKILSFIVNKNIKPRFNSIKSLKNDRALNLLKIQSLGAHKNKSVAHYLLSYAANINNNNEIRITALTTLEKTRLKALPELPSSIYKDSNDAMRAAAIKYWSTKNKNSLYKNHSKYFKPCNTR